MRSQPGQISGYFISFTPEEKSAIDEGLQEEGYSQDSDGLKEFILDSLTGEEPEPRPQKPSRTGKLEQFILENPETVARLVQGAGGLYKTVVGSMQKKKGR